MNTIQAQCNYTVNKCIYRGVEAIRIKSYLAGAPSTMCLKSLVTVVVDRITKGKSSANRFQAWQADHELLGGLFSRQISHVWTWELDG